MIRLLFAALRPALLLALLTSGGATLLAQSFTLSASSLSVPIIGGTHPTRAKIGLISTDARFPTAKLQITSDRTWLRAVALPGNTGLSLEIDPGSIPETNSASNAKLTIKAGTQTRVLSLFRARLGLTPEAALGGAYLMRAHPDRPILYFAAYSYLLAVNARDLTLRDWAPLPGTIDDLIVTRDGLRLHMMYRDSPTTHLTTFRTEPLQQETDHSLPGYSGYGSDYSSQIAEGPGGTIYQLEKTGYYNNPRLRVLSPDGQTVRQTIQDVAVGGSPPPIRRLSHLAGSPALDQLWVSHSLSGGSQSVGLTRYKITPSDGTLTELDRSPALHRPVPSNGGIIAAPVCFSTDGEILACHLGLLYPSSDQPLAPRLLAESVQALSPDGNLGLTRRGLVTLPDGELIHPLAAPSAHSAFSADGTRFFWIRPQVYPVAASLNTVDLPTLFATSALAKRGSPTDGSRGPAPEILSWQALPSARAYRVYRADSAAALAVASPAAGLLLGETNATSLTLATPPPPGTTYYWRVDALVSDQVSVGPVRSFQVFAAAPAPSVFATASVRGTLRHVAVLSIAAHPATPWSLTSNTSWLAPALSTGSGPGTVDLVFSPATLEAGVHTVILTLRSGTDEIPLPVTLTIDPLAPTTLRDATSTGLYYALSESPGSERAHLLEINPATGTIERSIVAGSSASDLVFQASENRLYVAHWLEGKVRAFDADTLALARSLQFDLPRLGNDEPRADAHRLFPARADRLLVENGPRILGPNYYETSSGNRQLSLVATDGRVLDTAAVQGMAAAASDPATDSYFRFGYFIPTGSGEWSGSGDIRRIKLSADTLKTEKTVRTSSSDAPFGSSPLFIAHTPDLRLHIAGLSYDRDFATKEISADILFAISPDRRIQIARHLAYQDGQPRILPPASWRVFDPASGRIVSASATQLYFSDPATLPPAPSVVVQVTSTTDDTASLEWSTPPDHVPADAPYQIQQRRVGQEYWTTTSASAGDIPRRATVRYLQAETQVQFRIRYYQGGQYTPWSEPALATLAIARPDSNYWSSLPGEIRVDEQGTLSVPFTGKDLSFTTEGLPPGLSYDAATQSITGVCSIPGRYTATITATNISGSRTITVNLLVRTHTAVARGARYTGLLDFEGGPLTGIWSATRSIDTLTGTYRSVLFTRSFRATFKPGNSYGDYRTASTKVIYDGVAIHLHFNFDTATDKISMFANTSGLVENFGTNTTPETGLPSHWWGGTLPYPRPGRHTALLVPGDGNGPLQPQGAGFVRLDVTTDGAVTLRGETPLGQAFTQSTFISDLHSFPVFYYKNDTVAVGSLELPGPAEDLPPLWGQLVWAKDTNRKASSYRDGFEQELLVFGAPLPATGKKLPPLAPLANPAGAADFLLADGGLDRLSKPITQVLTPAPTGFTVPKAGTPANPNRVAVKLDSATGLVTGSAAVLDALGKKTLRTVNFRGMLVKDPLGDGEDVIGGYFLFPDAKGVLQSGRLEITEPEEPAPVFAK